MATDIDKLAKQLNCTEEQMQEFKAAFDLFDRDGSGAISKDELGQVMKNLGLEVSDHDLGEMIKEHDEDSSGQIEFNEFCHLMRRHMEEGEKEENLRAAFRAFDADGSGKITSDELRQVMCNLGERLTDDEVSEMIREADRDGDGQIDYEEFVQMMCTKS